MSEENNSIDEAIKKVALGGTYSTKKINGHNELDNMGNKVFVGDSMNVSERDVPPNPEFLKILMGQQIGGPEDWC